MTRRIYTDAQPKIIRDLVRGGKARERLFGVCA